MNAPLFLRSLPAAKSCTTNWVFHWYYFETDMKGLVTIHGGWNQPVGHWQYASNTTFAALTMCLEEKMAIAYFCHNLRDTNCMHTVMYR